MENLGIFYDHLDYFKAIGNFLWAFGIFCGNLVYFSPFWNFGPRKIWQPWSTRPAKINTFLEKTDGHIGNFLPLQKEQIRFLLFL
jgi:hypothetical protein